MMMINHLSNSSDDQAARTDFSGGGKVDAMRWTACDALRTMTEHWNAARCSSSARLVVRYAPPQRAVSSPHDSLTHCAASCRRHCACRARWWSVLCSCSSSSSSKFQMPSADVIETIKTIQETQLMLTNPRDAFRGQSRSPNIVAFHMLGIVFSCAIVTLSLRRAIFRIFDFKNVVTLKSESEVTQGYWKWHHSIDCV